MPAFRTFQGDFETFRYAAVEGPDGVKVPIARFWAQKPAILVFLRHFGCMACRAHAQDVWSKREQLQQGGAQIIFIGNGAASYIDGFKEEFGLEGAPVFTDSSLKSFALGGFYRGAGALVNPRTALNMAKLALQGHRNGNPLNPDYGSNFQLGGVIVVQPGGRVTYHYVSTAVGDTPEGGEIPDAG